MLAAGPRGLSPTLTRIIPASTRSNWMAHQNKTLKGRYDTAPYDIFRFQKGKVVNLREFAAQQARGTRSYDLKVHEDGLVHPAQGDTYIGPNGCSCRPMGINLQELVDHFQDNDNMFIFRIPAGLKLPEEVVLLHERTDHHSLQCAIPMKLEDLNASLTELFQKQAETMSKEQFWERYPVE